MKYRFYNAQILMSGKVVNGEVHTDGNKIVFAGTNAPLFHADKEINVNNNLLMPGFVNAHAHTPSTVLRGVADDVSLADFLDKIVPLEQALTDDDVYWSVMLGIAEYVRGGITAVEENYSRLEPIIRAFKKAGFRARISIGYPNFNEQSEQDLKWQYKLVTENGFNAVCYAHSVYGTRAEFFDHLVNFAGENNLEFALHLSETLKEVGDCSVKFDKTPVELIESYGFLDKTCTCYHSVHCDKDDLALLASYDANVVTCPASNCKLASGIPPIYAMQQAGINIAIGTDGAYSNNSYDMFKEMFLTAVLNKVTLYKPDIITAGEVVEMATKNGAKVVGYNCGEIKAGCLADIIIVDLRLSHAIGQDNLLSHLVYSAKSSDIIFTMVDGKVLYENGEYYIGEEINTIYKKIAEIRSRILGE